MQLHELVEASEPVAETCVLNPLFVCDDKVVKGKQRMHAVHKEVPVTWDVTNWIPEKCEVHDLRQLNQGLDVVPVAYVVVVEVEELQIGHALKDLGRRQAAQ